MPANSPYPARLRLLLPFLGVAWFGSGPLRAYVLMDDRWGTPTITFHLQLGAVSGAALSDGTTSWNNAASSALSVYNPLMTRLQILVVNPSTAARVDGNSRNEVFFSSTAYGEDLGAGTLAVTTHWKRGTTKIEADVIFNTAYTWDSYRGPLRESARDFRRVAIHEFGHAVGLNHPDESGQQVAAIMNSIVNNTDALLADDIAGVRALYGGTVATDDHGDTLSAATSLTSGVAMTGVLTANDKDVFRIVITSQSNLAVATTGTTDTFGRLLDGSGTALAINDDVSDLNRNFFIYRMGLAAGTYYIEVSGYGGTTTGGYSIRADVMSTAAPVVSTDDHGNTIATATTLSLATSLAGILTTGDVDMFRVTLPDTDALTVFSSGGIDTLGRLLNNTGAELASDDDGGSGSNFLIQRTGLAAGTYYVEVKGYNSTTTGAYQIRADFAAGVTATRPVITTQPVSRTTTVGGTATFSVVASSSTTLSYRWNFNGAPLMEARATGSSFVFLPTDLLAPGIITVSVTVSNAAGSINSNTASLTLTPSTVDPGRLVNLSILAALAAGETMTLGTVLGGSGTGGAKALVTRAAGPSLAAFNINGRLSDPKIALVSSATNTTVASNDDWSGNASLVSAFSQVGAFPFASASSKDSGIFQSALPGGPYTLQVSDAGGASGTVIAEIYDATPPAAFTSTTPRLVNVSVLKQIAGGTTLTAGFVIGGSSRRTVLVRAVGPTLALAPFNIGGAMPDPKLELFNNSTGAKIAENNDWGTPVGTGAASATQLSAAFGSVGAFVLASNATRDAVILVTLAPGQYSATASANSGGGGTAIIEIYEVP